MKKTVLIIISLLIFVCKGHSQYWDWVIDKNASAAFTEEYIGYQYIKMMEWYALYELMKDEQKGIESKATFIEMVRDSLFHSLQDVSGIRNGKDEQFIRKVFDEIDVYYSKIKGVVNEHPEYNSTYEQYNRHITRHAKDLLSMANMAVKGNDERNLLDKNERLNVLSFVLGKLREMRGLSKDTYEMLDVGISYQMLLNRGKP
jgi:hypothetical protein